MEAIRRKLLPNPREKANIISVLFFFWTTDMFKRGYKHVFGLEDLFQPLTVDHSNKLGDRLEEKWKKQLRGSGKATLWKAVFATFWREILLQALVTSFNDLFLRLTHPYLLGQLLLYFRKDSTMSYNEALCYAGTLMTIIVINVVIMNQYFIMSFHNGMKVRISVCSIIYRKALRLSQTALGETSPGKIVNLLSNDVNRFDMVFIFFNSLWSAPLSSLVIAYLLYLQVGWPGVIGVLIGFLVLPIQAYTSKLSGRFRLQTAIRTDERVRFMDEIISGVQVIKMYAWEVPFSKLIALARKMELKIVQKNAYVRGLYMTFLLFNTRVAIFCTMLSIVLLSGTDDITPSNVFVMAMYFTILSQAMSQMFVRGLAELAETFVAFKRLQFFLEFDENDDRNNQLMNLQIINEKIQKKQAETSLDSCENLPPDTAISIKNATASWIAENEYSETAFRNHGQTHSNPVEGISNHKMKSATLKDINIDFKKGQLIGIIGAVGAGKSSLLEAILKELPLESGKISVCGSFSYACQEPWIFSGSARQNILFGENMNRNRFDLVVKSCDLLKDFEKFSDGEKTNIGERGTSLSGGQKARINLARATYREVDIYLLDDPLSAVDAHVGRHLFKECIGPNGILAKQGATRILVTHQVYFLKDADWVIVLKDGKIYLQGKPNDLSSKDIDFAELFQADIDADTFPELMRIRLNSNDIDAPSIKRRSRTYSNSSQKSFMSSVEDISKEDNKLKKSSIEKSMETVQVLESTSKGVVHGSLLLKYLANGGNVIQIFIIFVLFVMTQLLGSLGDYWVANWTYQEELRRYYSNKNHTITASEHFNHTNEQLVDANNVTDDDLKDNSYWDSYGLLTTNTCIYIHGALVLSMLIIGLCRSFSFYTMCVRASQKLHDNMFKGVIHTTMHFFDTNSSGRILNRFSKDMGSADEYLPKAILDAGQILLAISGSILLCAVVVPYLLICIAAIGVIFMFVRKVYLKTSKNLRRMDGITRSPVFTHFSATISGLSTIRAFNAQKVLIDEFDNHQDLHTACWYSFISTSSAFGICLDILCVFFMFIVLFSVFLIDDGILSDKVGLLITQAMTLTGMLQWGVRQSAEVENQLMSVERILEYRNLTSEPQPKKPKQISKNWPEDGRLEFRNVYYYYVVDVAPVLHDLSFIVNSNEKIGIVGRTGAGKSSLIGAIFRLANIKGKILIDDIDTETISLHDIRSKVSIIPQDPVLFSGTLRKNLDPFEEYSDANLWLALEEVELKDIAGLLGLQTAVMAGGNNFSVGQRQLICLARAILRNNKLLVLDEATANVDPQTDSLIQKTIRVKFAKCTILTIAHRLHTIIDSDRILVMDSGKAIEFATAHELLQMPTGVFKEMIKSLGPQESEKLTKSALEKFESIKKIK